MSYEGVKLSISDEVKSLLEERGIKEDDVKQVIHNAEVKGEKLYKTDTERFLAKKRLEEFTVYAEYSPTKDGYELHSAYGHRTKIVSDGE